MSGECEDCGEHTLECKCKEEVLTNRLLQYLERDIIQVMQSYSKLKNFIITINPGVKDDKRKKNVGK